MKGVGLIDKSNITCEFTDHSIDLKVRNLDGKHYRLNITRTHQPIQVPNCEYEVKKNSIEVLVVK